MNIQVGMDVILDVVVNDEAPVIVTEQEDGKYAMVVDVKLPDHATKTFIARPVHFDMATLNLYEKNVRDALETAKAQLEKSTADLVTIEAARVIIKAAVKQAAVA